MGDGMNTAEQIYQDVKDFPEPLALEVLHFVEFLKTKKLLRAQDNATDLARLEDFLKSRIEAAEQGKVINKSVLDIFAQVHAEELH